MSYLDKWFEYTARQLEMKEEIEKAILRVHGSTLNLNEFFLLDFLHKAPSQRLMQLELQDKLHLSASAISRMLAKLEAKDCGVIEKASSKSDKRVTYIVLTDAGRKMLADIFKEVEASLAKYSKFLD